MKHSILQTAGAWLVLIHLGTPGMATEWVSPVDGDWGVAANWSAGAPAFDLPAVIIQGSGPRVVTVSASSPDATLSVQRLTLSNDGGGESLLRLDQTSTRALRLWDSLNVNAGGAIEVVNSQLEFDGTASGGGFHLNAGRLVLQSGAWRVTGGVTRLGRTGSATATILGGQFTTDSDVLVGDQPGSSGQWILRGGSASVQGILYLADDPGATGAMVIDGGTLAVTGPTLRVGDDGAGRLDLRAGSVTADSVSVGRGSGSSGEVHMTGGSWRAGDFSLGRFAGSQGLMTMSDGVFEAPADTLFIGREGAGEFRLDGGQVTSAEVVLAAAPGARGLLVMTGGKLSTGRLIAEQATSELRLQGGEVEVVSASVNNGAALVIGDGVRPAVLRLLGGTNVFAGGLVIETNARLEGRGVIQGALTVRGIDAREGQGTPPATAPRLSLVRASTGWAVNCATEAGWIYFLEDADEVQWGTWRAVGGGVSGTGGTVSLPVPDGPAARLLRVRVAAP